MFINTRLPLPTENIICEGNVSGWSYWSPCSASCGPGTRQRVRRFEGPYFRLRPHERAKVISLCPVWQNESCNMANCGNGQFNWDMPCTSVGESGACEICHVVEGWTSTPGMSTLRLLLPGPSRGVQLHCIVQHGRVVKQSIPLNVRKYVQWNLSLGYWIAASLHFCYHQRNMSRRTRILNPAWT